MIYYQIWKFNARTVYQWNIEWLSIILTLYPSRRECVEQIWSIQFVNFLFHYSYLNIPKFTKCKVDNIDNRNMMSIIRIKYSSNNIFIK